MDVLAEVCSNSAISSVGCTQKHSCGHLVVRDFHIPGDQQTGSKSYSPPKKNAATNTETPSYSPSLAFTLALPCGFTPGNTTEAKQFIYLSYESLNYLL